ncbi:TetR/AcrR family transcriptional regulator [Brachybacterium sp.]|uniref:TetR/AcrR family transcriptional regulator n=1 Tax=Brachybacterium sp. TaxID=1891286 RepID=UPI002ED50DC3
MGDGRGAAEHSQDGTTPERILAAAAAILGEDGITARLSVRAVAARAEVSIGSLRHHFPTQQALRDEVMRRVYDWMLPESSIEDRSVPARDRLVGCLRGVLDMSGAGAEARSSMITVTSSFIAVEPTEPVREAYLAMQRDGQQRMEQWLRALAAERAEDEVLAADEGVGDLVAERDIVRDARFLATVLNGLALERALPAEDSLAHAETEALYMAADAVLEPRPPR